MEPATAGAIGAGLVLLGVGLALGIFVYGRTTRQDEIDTLRGMLDIAQATIRLERQQRRAAARGAADDLGKAVDLAGAAAVGDLDRVLQQFPGDPPGAVAGKHGREADPSGGHADDPA